MFHGWGNVCTAGRRARGVSRPRRLQAADHQEIARTAPDAAAVPIRSQRRGLPERRSANGDKKGELPIEMPSPRASSGRSLNHGFSQHPDGSRTVRGGVSRATRSGGHGHQRACCAMSATAAALVSKAIHCFPARSRRPFGAMRPGDIPSASCFPQQAGGLSTITLYGASSATKPGSLLDAETERCRLFPSQGSLRTRWNGTLEFATSQSFGAEVKRE